MDEKRVRGTIVRTLDMTSLYDEIATMVRDRIKDDVTAVNTPYRWALATDHRGVSLLICDEGVSWEVGEGGDVQPAGLPGPMPLDVWDATERRNPETGNKTLSMTPIATAQVALSELEALPQEEVDLAEFIRTFGARLEQNFWITRKLLTGKDRMEA